MPGIGLSADLYMGANALNANRLAIEVAGNNIANANTPNYTRQTLLLSADISLQLGAGQQGTGVVASQVQSIRNQLLDNQMVSQQSLGGFYQSQSDLGGNVQAVLGEQISASSTSNTGAVNTQPGIQADLNRFFDAWQALSTQPTSSTIRQDVINSGRSLSSDLNSAFSRLQQLQSSMGAQASSVTSQINSLATQVASLNLQIFQAELGGQGQAGNLRDTRQQDIEQLAQYVNISTSTAANGMINITLANAPAVSLVNGSNGGGAGTTQSLSTSFNAGVNPPLAVVASVSGTLAGGSVPSSGQLGALLRTVNQTIGSPAAVGNIGLLSQLDALANNLVTLVNNQSTAGFDLNGNPGVNFFTAASISAGNIQVAPAVAANTNLVAASNGSGPQSGANAILVANLRNNSNLGPAYQASVAGLGQTVQLANQQNTSQQLLIQQLQSQRSSQTGVNMDEEMTNLAVYQRAYESSAEFINTINQMFKTLITATGGVTG